VKQKTHMSSPVNTQIVLLRPRIPVLLGSIIATNAPVQFAPCESLTPRGQLTISAYQAGLSGVTAVLEASIDQGVSWFSIPATSTYYGTTVTGDTAAIVASRYDVSGLCGSQMRFDGCSVLRIPATGPTRTHRTHSETDRLDRKGNVRWRNRQGPLGI
jgi:hypothetical protein